VATIASTRAASKRDLRNAMDRRIGVVTLPEYRDKIKIMPFSGIQFLDFGLLLTRQQRPRDFWEEQRNSSEKTYAVLHQVEFDAERNVYATRDGRREIDSEEIYAITPEDAFNAFDRSWIPFPVFRVHGRPRNRPVLFIDGPTTWTRARIIKLEHPDDKGNTHRLIVAIDTAMASGAEREGGRDNRPYLMPSLSDSEGVKEFQVVDEPGRIAFFVNLPWVDEWLEDTFFRYTERIRAQRGRTVWSQNLEGGGPQRRCEPWACYITLMEVLHELVRFPVIQLADLFSQHSVEKPVDVDFVLDIGNSRTCGVLIEHHDGDIPTLSNSYPLELRDLSRPERVYAEPFESRVEFARPDFGNEQLAARSGRPDSFLWHSMVRTGPEAVSLCNGARGGEGATGLSSPKRYLWDERPSRHPWCFNTSMMRSVEIEPLVDSPVMQFVSDTGEVLSLLKGKKRDETMAAFQPRFSRSSLFTFMLQEVVLQAFIQINSAACRGNRPYSDRPRQIKRIVLTLPPGMALAERKLFRRRAEAAVRLTWDCLGAQQDELFKVPMPKLVEPFDEASSTQIVYLYSEVTRLQNGASDLIRAYGRPRKSQGSAPALRIASIDIGGGTTDLMVTTYELREGRQIVPHQNFRESFRIAGDDVLREIVSEHVLTCIGRHLRACGAVEPEVLIGRMFGADVAGMHEPQRHRRRQFIIEVAAPIAIRILALCEEVEVFGRPQRLSKPLRDFFQPDTMPSQHVQRFIDEQAHQHGAHDFKLLDVRVEVDLLAASATIQGVLEPILRDLCEVVSNLHCDLLLLSGRPSRLPIVKNVVLAKLPIAPNRIFAMSDYKVGSWYPFHDHLGKINDPKTTTAVGAMLALLAGGRLPNFRFEASRLTHRSTARYIGQLEIHGKLPDKSVVLANVDLDKDDSDRSATMKMVAPFFLGFRQLPIERWPTTHLYYFEFRDPQSVSPEGLPWEVRIGPNSRSRLSADDEARFEDFEIVGIETNAKGGGRPPRPNDVIMRLQTMKDANGYWLDTGVIRE
jgi:hypothetical protein